ncbi:MAG: hypothetical protein Tsb004_29980 [Allomuricauda sp.]
MGKIQKVPSQLPLIGSLGKHQSGLFKKNFQKIGEPYLSSPIAVAFESIAFNKSMKFRYSKYREYLGKQPSAILTDTSQTKAPRYYQLKITDLVHLVEELNRDENSSQKKYLQEDTDLRIMTHISFMAPEEMANRLEDAKQFYLKTDNNKVLTLYRRDASREEVVELSTLEIFDFKTAAFCWQKNKRGQLSIAQILLDGGTCPGATVSNPKTLNKTPDYLKL